MMKALPWVVLTIGLTSFALWIVAGPWAPKNSLATFSIAAFFGLSAVGGFWMLYMALRYEKHPLWFLLLALIPYTFLWYYFERVRPRRHLTRA